MSNHPPTPPPTAPPAVVGIDVVRSLVRAGTPVDVPRPPHAIPAAQGPRQRGLRGEVRRRSEHVHGRHVLRTHDGAGRARGTRDRLHVAGHRGLRAPPPPPPDDDDDGRRRRDGSGSGRRRRSGREGEVLSQPGGVGRLRRGVPSDGAPPATLRRRRRRRHRAPSPPGAARVLQYRFRLPPQVQALLPPPPAGARRPRYRTSPSSTPGAVSAPRPTSPPGTCARRSGRRYTRHSNRCERALPARPGSTRTCGGGCATRGSSGICRRGSGARSS